VLLAGLLLAGCVEQKAGWTVTDTKQGAILTNADTGQTWILRPNDMGYFAWFALSRGGPL